MAAYQAPGVYVEETSGGPRPIEAVGTSLAGFVGVAPDAGAHVNEPRPVSNWSEFARAYVAEGAASTPLSQAVYGFFLNGGSRCYVVNIGKKGSLADGLAGLERYDEIAIVAAPGLTDAASYADVLGHCEGLEDRVAVLDGPAGPVPDVDRLTRVATATPASAGDEEGGSSGDGLKPPASSYAAVYYPWITVRDPLSRDIVRVPPSGHVAGIWARTDATRGVHKAPANVTVRGALNVAHRVTRAEQEVLNQAGVNCIRLFGREGIKVWGARTLSDDPEWRYLNVRRLFNMVKESIAQGTRWIVFEPNDYTLWESIKRDIREFLMRQWRAGALMGRTPEEAFFVQCDRETNPPEVVNAGQVVTLIGIAPVKPAEFVIFRLSQYQAGTEASTEPQTEGGNSA